jgi:YggT family protein
MMIAVRLIASWFPSVRGQAWLRYMANCTDPYLNLFRRFIPPIGGTLDLSPMLGFILLQVLENTLMKLFV